MEYEETDLGLKIAFYCPELDLREIGIVSTAIHSALSRGVAEGLGLPAMLGIRSFNEDPLLLSLVLTRLELGSLSAEVKAKINTVFAQVSVAVLSSLIASTIWAIARSAPSEVQVKVDGNSSASRYNVDVGNNISKMVGRLSASGKPWKLIVEDKNSGVKVEIIAD